MRVKMIASILVMTMLSAVMCMARDDNEEKRQKTRKMATEALQNLYKLEPTSQGSIESRRIRGFRQHGGERIAFEHGTRFRSGRLVLAAGILCVISAQGAGAQVQTTTSIQSGHTTEVVRVDRGEVMAVRGNDLILKMENGSVRHFENIPESAKITVDGKQLGIHDLKPGMKLQRTITTTTTPQLVTTIETVKGKVWYINAPSKVILTLKNGTNQSFKIPKDQKFNVDGQMVDAFSLKKGMVVTATKIVEVPVTLVSQERSVTGTLPAPAMPTPPAVSETPVVTSSQEKSVVSSEEKSVSAPKPAPVQAPAADPPLLIAEGAPTAAPAEATETPAPPARSSPFMGRDLPLVGLVLLIIIALVVARSVRSKSRKT